MGDRRAESERRAQVDRRLGDRRRSSESRCAVFEVCRSKLHLVVINRYGNGPDAVITRSVRWRTDTNTLHSDQGVKELTEAFRALVNESKLSGCKVRIALSGEFCVTRVIAGTAEHVRRELNAHEERSQLYLSLGPGRKARATSFAELDARHQHALLSVTNQKTLDTLIHISDAVGIQIDSIEPSLLSLTRIHARLPDRGDEACLIIQVDERGAELGICDRGRLLLDYRPAGRGAAAKLPNIVSEHLNRLERYLHRMHGYESAKLERVYLTGEPGLVELSRRKFDEFSQFSAQVIDPKKIDADWSHHGGDPGTELAAALGTALTFINDESDQLGPNLMEHVLAEARPPMQPFLMRAAIPIAAVFLVACGLLVGNVKETAALRSLQSQLDQLASVQNRAKELRLKLMAAQNMAQQIVAVEQKLHNPSWSKLFAHIGQSMPDDVWLERLAVSDSHAGSLAGASYTEGGVYDFAGYLEQVPELNKVALAGTGIGHSELGPTTSFDLEFSLAARAGRSGGADGND